MTLGETEFRCFCCKKKVEAKRGSICIDLYKNNRYAMRGICPDKKCSLSKIISNEKAEELKRKYNDCSNSDDHDDHDGIGVAEAGGIFALFALLAGTIAFGVKSAKNC